MQRKIILVHLNQISKHDIPGELKMLFQTHRNYNQLANEGTELAKMSFHELKTSFQTHKNYNQLANETTKLAKTISQELK